MACQAREGRGAPSPTMHTAPTHKRGREGSYLQKSGLLPTKEGERAPTYPGSGMPCDRHTCSDFDAIQQPSDQGTTHPLAACSSCRSCHISWLHHSSLRPTAVPIPANGPRNNLERIPPLHKPPPPHKPYTITDKPNPFLASVATSGAAAGVELIPLPGLVIRRSEASATPNVAAPGPAGGTAPVGDATIWPVLPETGAENRAFEADVAANAPVEPWAGGAVDHRVWMLGGRVSPAPATGVWAGDGPRA
jgi:hypothetical protein